MAHLEAFWHPWFDKMTISQQGLFNRAMSNQAHQQMVLDQVWNVEIDVENTEISMAFSFIPSPEACIALKENGFLYSGYKMVKKTEEEGEFVRMCDIYTKMM